MFNQKLEMAIKEISGDNWGNLNTNQMLDSSFLRCDRTSSMAQWVTKLPSVLGDRDVSSIPGSGRSPGGGNGNPLQYSSLGHPTDRGAWQATVHSVEESRT